MRLPQLLLPLFITVWLFLASLGWVAAALVWRREPRLPILLLGLATGLAAAVAPAVVGQQGMAGFVASFPLAFVASLVVCCGAGVRQRRWLSGRGGFGYHECDSPRRGEARERPP